MIIIILIWLLKIPDLDFVVTVLHNNYFQQFILFSEFVFKYIRQLFQIETQETKI